MVQEPTAASPNPRWLGLFGLLLGGAVAGFFFLREPAPATLALPPEENHAPPLFQGWGKNPDVVIVVSGEMHGYLQPCGCSRPQKGGLARRYNFIESLRKKWPVVAGDLGDLPQASGP